MYASIALSPSLRRSQAWQAEIEQHFEQEIKIHFAAEEDVSVPGCSHFPELIPIVEELIADHASLRESFSRAEEHRMSAETCWPSRNIFLRTSAKKSASSSKACSS